MPVNQRNACHDFILGQFRRNRVNGSLQHRGVFLNRMFNFISRHVFAFDAHELRVASDKVEVAFFIPSDQVSGVYPAVFKLVVAGFLIFKIFH